jgi:hypothetical protein
MAEPGAVYSATFVDATEDGLFAIEVISMPTEDSEVSTLESVLEGLRLRAEYEIPGAYLAEALAATLATRDVVVAADWLRSSPEPVPLEAPTEAGRRTVDTNSLDLFILDEREEPSSRPYKRPRRDTKFVSPVSPESDRLRYFTRDVLERQVVPFRQSPLDLHSLQTLLHAAQGERAWLVTAGTRPLVLAKVAGGYLLFKAVKGVGKGVEGGLAAGVQYRILKLFGTAGGVEDDKDPGGPQP